MDPSDQELLVRVGRGDPAAARALFDRHAPALLAFAGRLLGSRAEAEEVVQEAFVKLVRQGDRLDTRGGLSAWLFAVAANGARDRLRHARVAGAAARDLAAVPTPPAAPALDALIEGERARALTAALARLSPEQREALVLARFHELPYVEIARLLGISEAAVKNRILRAMTALRALMSAPEPRKEDVTCNALK